MCPCIFLGPAARVSVVSAFDLRNTTNLRKPHGFDRGEAAACATSAISNLLAAALPELAAHKRCTCARLAFSGADLSAWASQLEIGLEEAGALQSNTVSSLSEILTGPPHSQHMPFHVVKPSLLGRRAPSADKFFDAALQHAWMSAADLMMLLAREAEMCLRECMTCNLQLDAACVADDGHSVCERSPTKTAADDCFSLNAVLSHTVIFSCRRNFLESALNALDSSAARLCKTIAIDFPHRVAAADNIGTSTRRLYFTQSNLNCFQASSTAGIAHCFTSCQIYSRPRLHTSATLAYQMVP